MLKTIVDVVGFRGSIDIVVNIWRMGGNVSGLCPHRSGRRRPVDGFPAGLMSGRRRSARRIRGRGCSHILVVLLQGRMISSAAAAHILELVEPSIWHHIGQSEPVVTHLDKEVLEVWLMRWGLREIKHYHLRSLVKLSCERVSAETKRGFCFSFGLILLYYKSLKVSCRGWLSGITSLQPLMHIMKSKKA